MRTTTAANEPKRTAWFAAGTAPAPCPTCRGHTVIDRGVDLDSGADLIAECPDC